jgi:hypothetical protein
MARARSFFMFSTNVGAWVFLRFGLSGLLRVAASCGGCRLPVGEQGRLVHHDMLALQSTLASLEGSRPSFSVGEVVGSTVIHTLRAARLCCSPEALRNGGPRSVVRQLGVEGAFLGAWEVFCFFGEWSRKAGALEEVRDDKGRALAPEVPSAGWIARGFCTTL